MRLVAVVSVTLNVLLVALLVGVLAGSMMTGVAVAVLLVLVLAAAIYLAWERGALGKDAVAESRNTTGSDSQRGTVPPVVAGTNIDGGGFGS